MSSPIGWIPLVAVCVAALCGAFNVDTNFPQFFRGSDGSYFGFSVALHTTRGSALALVTAPRANSTFRDRLALHQPGALFKCPLSERCSEVPLDQEGNSEPPPEKGTTNVYRRDKKDDGWLGVSLDIQPNGNNIVTCGHLWKNQVRTNSGVDYLTNGVCYLINEHLDTSTVLTLLPLLDKKKQMKAPDPVVMRYAYGLAGMSAAFTESGRRLYLGAPGVNDFTGTIASYRTPQTLPRNPTATVPESSEVDFHSYLGYSTTSGYFTSDYILPAVGAPRDGKDRGRVYIAGVPEDKKFAIMRTLEGEQVGEYFGAAVLGVDLDRDDQTDLLVGAPLHSLCRTTCEEEGLVYVFKSTGQEMTLQEKLSGSGVRNARFGTTLAAAGDLNRDTYPDVAIGAPFENGRGAVYLYYGSKNGIRSRFVQRIAAEDVDAGLSGFGMGIARGKDIDGNSYPDLLVGAFSADTAVLFRSRPIVTVEGRFQFAPTEIIRDVNTCMRNNVRVPCLNVTYCLLNKEDTISTVEVAIRLQMDSGKKQADSVRGYFLYEGGTPSVVQRRVSLQRSERCWTLKAYLKANVRDIVTPIQFNLSYTLPPPPTASGFCSTCPVLDEETPNFITGQVPFWTGCGKDGVCVSDLKLKARVLEYSEGEELVIGKHTVLTVSVEVQNVGEPAYMSDVTLELPDHVHVKNQGRCHIQQGTSVALVCGLANPLNNGDKDKFEVKLDTSKLTLEAQVLTLTLQATTKSEERNLGDNNVTFKIPFRVQALIDITGTSDREQIPFTGEPGERAVPLVHIYTVTKQSRGNITSVGVEIGVPVKVYGHDQEFLNITDLQIGDPGRILGNCTLTSEAYKIEDDFFEPGGGGDLQNVRNRRRRPPFQPWSQKQQIGEMPKDDSVVVNCHAEYGVMCRKITCEFGPFLNNVDTATVTITAAINGTHLQDQVGKMEAIAIVSHGQATVTDNRYGSLPLSQRSDTSTATTVLVKPGPPPPAKVQIWIIVVSVIAGVLLLAVILLVLAKLGFFKRFNKEQMEKLQEEKLIENNDAAEPKPETTSPD